VLSVSLTIADSPTRSCVSPCCALVCGKSFTPGLTMVTGIGLWRAESCTECSWISLMKRTPCLESQAAAVVMPRRGPRPLNLGVITGFALSFPLDEDAEAQLSAGELGTEVGTRQATASSAIGLRTLWR